MSLSTKLNLRKLPKREQESHVVISSDASVRTPLISNDDYQAPLTAHKLSPKSKWLIVRHNIHRIRSWGMIRQTGINQPFQDWYIFFQMRRELKRAEEQIRALQYRPDFIPVHYFELSIDDTRVQRYNVSHVRPTDGIYYAGLGSEPIVLQYLLYYFSKDCPVPYNSIFHSFLYDVNSVLDTNRKRIHRVVVFRKLALIFTLAVFILLLIMFFSLILSVLTTTSNLREMYRIDPISETIPNVTQISRLVTSLYKDIDDQHDHDHDQ
ncbi:hypothetical protein I4U23_013661 [Adineta vaga]|nr:hypothetical protein I4U23_013661 [Adineta vaga]